MKIKTTYEGCPYITAGKVYPVVDKGIIWARIYDNEGELITVTYCNKACTHLGYIGTWEVVEE